MHDQTYDRRPGMLFSQQHAHAGFRRAHSTSEKSEHTKKVACYLLAALPWDLTMRAVELRAAMQGDKEPGMQLHGLNTHQDMSHTTNGVLHVARAQLRAAKTAAGHPGVQKQACVAHE